MVAALLGIGARLIRQPILLAYIATGMLLGAGGLGVISDPELTKDIASIGIIFLLFLVGLELDISKIRELGRVVLITGISQLAVVAALGYLAASVFGLPSIAALYLGLAAAFSSTAVVLKRLSDERQLSSLSGRVIIGVLLLQDLIAVLLLMLISGIDGGSASWSTVWWFLVKGMVFLGATWLVTRFVLGRLFYFIAKSAELLFLTSIAWAFLFAVISDALGFSKEIGAFLAGISLATLPYNFEIIGRVRPLRDFFLVILFVVLGLEVSLPTVAANLPLIIVFVVLVVVVKTVVGAAAMVLAGYPKRPAYLTGASLGQMSEFSLLVVLIASSFNQIPDTVVAITAALLVITIIINTYWMSLGRYVYPVLSKPLGWIAKRNHHRPGNITQVSREGHTLLFGANRMGSKMLQSLTELKHDVLVVDHNPEVIRRLMAEGVDCVYGDIDDFELLEEMGLAKAKMVVSTVSSLRANTYLLEETKRTNPNAVIIVTADRADEALDLYAAGADYVVLPHLLGGEQAARLIQDVHDPDLSLPAVARHRQKHVAYLKQNHQPVPAVAR